MDVNYTIVIDTVFLKFEYPCETRLPGSMGDPILSNMSETKRYTLTVSNISIMKVKYKNLVLNNLIVKTTY